MTISIYYLNKIGNATKNAYALCMFRRITSTHNTI